jgi:hypothetical protein
MPSARTRRRNDPQVRRVPPGRRRTTCRGASNPKPLADRRKKGKTRAGHNRLVAHRPIRQTRIRRPLRCLEHRKTLSARPSRTSHNRATSRTKAMPRPKPRLELHVQRPDAPPPREGYLPTAHRSSRRHDRAEDGRSRSIERVSTLGSRALATPASYAPSRRRAPARWPCPASA